MTTRLCARCLTERDEAEFPPRRPTVCRPCRAEQFKLWAAEKKDREQLDRVAEVSRLINWPAHG